MLRPASPRRQCLEEVFERMVPKSLVTEER
jgi:hypothetical protein